VCPSEVDGEDLERGGAIFENGSIRIKCRKSAIII
jgi:hypothetical protein